VWKRFLAIEPGWYIRSLLRCARGDERDRASRSDVRLHCGACPCLGSGRKRGQNNQALGRSRGGFSTKIHLKTDFGAAYPSHFISPVVRRATVATSKRLSTSAPISIRVPHSATRATIPNQIATLHVNAEYVRQSRIDPTPKTYPPSFQRFSTRARPYRASSREAQTIQAHRTSMQEDGAELQLVRRACSRHHLDQIRPHGLAFLCHGGPSIRQAAAFNRSGRPGGKGLL
jgi:hypothetical protein